MVKNNNLSEAVSIKQLFQGMTSDDVQVIQGVVVSVDPLKIQAVNDDKLVLSANILIVPWQLTDYTTKMSFDDDSIAQPVTIGEYAASTSATLCTNPATVPVYTPAFLPGDLRFTSKIEHTVTIYNALNVGEKVHLLSFNHGKKYYVMDRVV